MEVIKMPRGDRTGPGGQGMCTGRGMGFCNGYNVAGYANRGGAFPVGRRSYMNAGGGWGHRNWYHATGLPGWMREGRYYTRPQWGVPVAATVSKSSYEMELLREEAAYFEKALEGIREHISKLESASETDEYQTGG